MISKNLQSLSRSLEQFFLTVGQNNFGNKTPFPIYPLIILIFNQSQIVRARISVLIILPLIIPTRTWSLFFFWLAFLPSMERYFHIITALHYVTYNLFHKSRTQSWKYGVWFCFTKMSLSLRIWKLSFLFFSLFCLIVFVYFDSQTKIVFSSLFNYLRQILAFITESKIRL